MNYLINALISFVISTAMAIVVFNTTELPPQKIITTDKLVVDHIDAHLVNMEYGSVHLRNWGNDMPGITLGADRDYAGIRVYNKDKTAYIWASDQKGLESYP